MKWRHVNSYTIKKSDGVASADYKEAVSSLRMNGKKKITSDTVIFLYDRHNVLNRKDIWHYELNIKKKQKKKNINKSWYKRSEINFWV